jgi:trimethylamine:corrinoid methyltransferase-like protein
MTAPQEENMKFKGQILSEEERIRIHNESLHILSGVGVKFYGEKALPLLERNGAKVDWEGKIARIPGEMVAEALQAAPKSFVLGARNLAYDFTHCPLRSRATPLMGRPPSPWISSLARSDMAHPKISRTACASSSR